MPTVIIGLLAIAFGLWGLTVWWWSVVVSSARRDPDCFAPGGDGGLGRRRDPGSSRRRQGRGHPWGV